MFCADNLSEIKVIKQNERQKITLVQDSTGKKYIRRYFSEDKREVYKALQKINHPGIPRIYDVSFSDGTVITEQYIHGKSLTDCIEQNTIFDKKQIYSVAKQLLAAMEAIHNEKIIHKDIKPDNIIIDDEFNLWLTDFDIARIYRDEFRKDTEVIGTFGYAPIEQYGMMPTDYKTDIFSFGATIKALLKYAKIKCGLSKIAEKCNMLDPSQRYKSVKDVRLAIKRRYINIIAAIAVGIIVLCCTVVYLIQNINAVPGYVKVDSEITEAIRFDDFENTFVAEKYKNYDGYSNLTIFGADSAASHLLFAYDEKIEGKIALGRNNATSVDASIELREGVLHLALSDPYGHTFEHSFSYNGEHEFELVYNEHRRYNADIICWDVDGDGTEELLAGISDTSFWVEEQRVMCYPNYCMGWCIRYDESRGFELCDGDMFSEGTKFWLYKDEIGVHLPYYSKTAQKHSIIKYMLRSDDTIYPSYLQ